MDYAANIIFLLGLLLALRSDVGVLIKTYEEIIMSQKSHSKYYAAVTANSAVIVESWSEAKAKALTSGKPRGKTKGASTYEEAEVRLKELVAERDHSMNFNRRR